MSDALEIRDSEYDFQNYFNEVNLPKDVQTRLDNSEMLIVPTHYAKGEYYFPNETVQFYKFCKQRNNDNIEFLADDSTGIQTRILHSFDIWMPIIFVASEILLPVAVGLVTNYIYDKMKGRESEKNNVKITFIVKDNYGTKELTYDGDAKSFKNIFDAVDIEKLME